MATLLGYFDTCLKQLAIVALAFVYFPKVTNKLQKNKEKATWDDQIEYTYYVTEALNMQKS